MEIAALPALLRIAHAQLRESVEGLDICRPPLAEPPPPTWRKEAAGDDDPLDSQIVQATPLPHDVYAQLLYSDEHSLDRLDWLEGGIWLDLPFQYSHDLPELFGLVEA